MTLEQATPERAETPELDPFERVSIALAELGAAVEALPVHSAGKGRARQAVAQARSDIFAHVDANDRI